MTNPTTMPPLQRNQAGYFASIQPLAYPKGYRTAKKAASPQGPKKFSLPSEEDSKSNVVANQQPPADAGSKSGSGGSKKA